MKVARVLITPEFLRGALHLPLTTEIVTACMLDEPYRMIEVTVRDPNLFDVELAEGEAPPLILPKFRRNVPVELIDWGQP